MEATYRAAPILDAATNLGYISLFNDAPTAAGAAKSVSVEDTSKARALADTEGN